MRVGANSIKQSVILAGKPKPLENQKPDIELKTIPALVARKMPLAPPKVSTDDPDVIRREASRNGVVLLDAPGKDAVELMRIAEALGKPMFSSADETVNQFVAQHDFSGADGTMPPSGVFQTEVSYAPEPPSFSVMLALSGAAQGATSFFTDQYAAAAELPKSLLELAKNASVRHVEPGAERPSEVWHPLFRKHPQTKRFSLFLSSVECMDRLRLRIVTRERRKLLPLLYRRSIRRHIKYRHHWQPGDILVWDNRCTLQSTCYEPNGSQPTFLRSLLRGGPPFWG